MEIEKEREYCLNCIHKPCSKFGCPLENDIPNFIKEKDYKKAYEILCRTTVLPSICGRICAQSKYCQSRCIRGINNNPVEIGKIEAYIGDIAIKNNYKIPKIINKSGDNEKEKKSSKTKIENNQKESINKRDKDNLENRLTIKSNELNKKKVAIIGSGPAGLTCAAFLAMRDIKVTIYEKNKELGGILKYGIPHFRLSKNIVNQSINKILELGISAKTEQELGKDFSIIQLLEKYDAVFISIGAGKNKSILKGKNILNGNTLLKNIAENEIEENFKKGEYNNYIECTKEKNKGISENTIPPKSLEIPDFNKKKVLVYGGGNVAIDTSRTLKRLGADVSIVYRRNIEQMPAEKNEIKEAQKEKINIIEKTNIISYENGIANCIKTELVKINKENTSKYNSKEISEKFENKKINTKKTKMEDLKTLERNATKVENIEGSNFEIKADYIVLAIGSKPDSELLENQGIKTNSNGFADIDENYHTSIKNVYAGGDLIGEEATVAYAARSGKESAKVIASELIKK